MTEEYMSAHARQDIEALMRRRGIDAATLAAKTGLEIGRVEALRDRERVVPSPAEMLSLCMILDAFPNDLMTWAPVEDFKERVWGRALSEDPARVCVVGAGNLGHVFAGLLSSRGEAFDVRWLTSSDARAADLQHRLDDAAGITVDAPWGQEAGGAVRVSADPAEVIPEAEVVVLCLPSFREPPVLHQIAGHLTPGTTLVSVPATGGIHWTAQEILGEHGVDGVELVGLAAIPWMCKVSEWGASVRVLGRKVVEMAAVLHGDDRALERVAHLTQIPTGRVPNFLAIILNPGNQILHPGILYGLFADWDGAPLDEAPLFYEGLSQQSADLVQALDDEMRAIGAALKDHDPSLDLSSALPVQVALMAAYGDKIGDSSSLRATISTNEAYAGIRTPMVEVDGGLAPNWSSRFIAEDIPYGLVVIHGMGEVLGVATPRTDEMIRWCQKKVGKTYLTEAGDLGPDAEASGAPQAHGFETPDALIGARTDDVR